MGGIHDIKNACAAAGFKVRGVTMRYDNALGEQVFTFVPVEGEPIVVSCGADVKPDQIVAMALQQQAPGAPLGLMSMPNLGPKVDERQIDLEDAIKDTVVKQALAQIGAGDYDEVTEEEMRDGVAVRHVTASPEGDISAAKVEIEHKGEKYELAHDGAPNALFF